MPSPKEAFADVRDSFDRFCLISGIEAMEQMLEEDANELCGDRHARNSERQGHRLRNCRRPDWFSWGQDEGQAATGARQGQKEIPLPSWSAAQEQDWLGQWTNG